jgi:hypothetical protein
MTLLVDEPIPAILNKASYAVKERFCIMTIDGGLSDDEALRRLGYFVSRGKGAHELSI